MARQYTVHEIMEMREAIQFIGERSPIAMSPSVIEDQLRTYMTNETEPAELQSVVVEFTAA